MRQLFFLILFSNCFIGFSTIKPPNKKDPCSECYTDPGKNDSIYYHQKIDSLTKIIANSEKESSEIFRVRGDYYACLAKYKHNMGSVFIKPAFGDLLKAISLDSTNWHAYRTLIYIYLSELTFEKKRLDPALKYANLLIKYNDTLGDSYITRVLISLLMNKLDSTESDLKKASKLSHCSELELIKPYEAFYYFAKGDFAKSDSLIWSSEANQYVDFYYDFIVTRFIGEFPSIRYSLISFVRKNKDKSFYIRILKDCYENNKWDIKEIDDLK